MKKQEAIVLDDLDLSVEGKKIAKILDFFGVPWRASTMTELLAQACRARKALRGGDFSARPVLFYN